MKKIKKYLISLTITFISILILGLILTILNYFSLIPYKINLVLKEIIPILSIFIGNLYLGKKIEKQGYIEGLKTGGFLIFIMIILSILIFDNFKLINILYYLLISIFSSLSSIISINLKDKATK